MLRMNCLLIHVREGEIAGRIEVMGRRGKRRKWLLDDLKETRGSCKLKEGALDRAVWSAGIGGGYELKLPSFLRDRETVIWIYVYNRPVHKLCETVLSKISTVSVFLIKALTPNDLKRRRAVNPLIIKIPSISAGSGARRDLIPALKG
jgi:hypothetical protein